MLLLNFLILPSSGQVYAACAPTSSGADTSGYTQDRSTCIWIPNLTPTETFTIDKTTSTTPTATLKIDNSTSAITDKINSSYGVTNYASHTVSVSVTEAGSYSLILSGPTQLSGPSTINATSGATGANLANDTWGYAWENTSVADANANYKALGSSVNLAGTALTNRATSFSKKLVFAAKFDKATAGIYHADVKLSLVATPEYTTTTVTATNAVPWDKLVYLQDMTNFACMQAKIGDSKTLTDIRDNNTYTIAKLSDGRCWMTQNLRFSDDTLKSGLDGFVSSYDTNTTNNWTHIPASTTGAFSSTDPSSGQIRSSTDSTYGAYYSFNAATVGTASSKTSGNAPGDICPKGWRLPTGGSSGEFRTLYNNGASSWTANGGKSGYWIGAANAASGGAFFPAAGNMNTFASVQVPGSIGYYWSSTIYNAKNAYGQSFDGGTINPALIASRYFGLSVRCVAQ